MNIVTKEELFSAKVPTRPLPLPELGEEKGVIVRALTIGDTLEIMAFSRPIDKDGQATYNHRNHILMSIVRAVEEPALTLEDSRALLEISSTIGDRICDACRELGGQTENAYEEMKQVMRDNPYVRRLYAACANVFHCLPSQLAGISEAEFNRALAAMEVEIEESTDRTDE